MKQVTLMRGIGNDHQTLGVLTVPGEKELFIAKSLELGWKDNKNQVSCIPADGYICKWTRSNRLSKAAGHDIYTYEIMNVPGRAGIRIHSANYFFQLLGCIALGSVLKDINADRELDVIHSGDTVKAFNELMNKEDFVLNIIDNAA